jgi:FMN-dependent NADH-azoreductase
MKLLHIDASILGDNSVSRQITAAVVARLTAADPTLDLVYRDLAAAPLAHISGAHLAGQVDAEAQAESAAVLAEFIAADTVVIGAPMYNFTIPSQLKAWLDRVLVAGKTFKYGASGPEGLMAGKRVILAISRGGFYGAGTPAAAAEHLETYLRSVLGVIGITDIDVVAADGVAYGPEQRQAALTNALQAATELKVA